MAGHPSESSAGETSGPSQSQGEGTGRGAATPETVYFWEDAEEMKTVVEALRYHEEPSSPTTALISSLHHPMVLSSGGSDFFPLWEQVVVGESKEETKAEPPSP